VRASAEGSRRQGVGLSVTGRLGLLPTEAVAAVQLLLEAADYKSPPTKDSADLLQALVLSTVSSKHGVEIADAVVRLMCAGNMVPDDYGDCVAQMLIGNLEGAAFTAAVRALIAASGEAQTLRDVDGETICDVLGILLSPGMEWASSKWSRRAVEAELVAARAAEAAVRLCHKAPSNKGSLFLMRCLAELQDDTIVAALLAAGTIDAQPGHAPRACCCCRLVC
jgi:hypothetical protein